jgi:hypothetical protein
MQLSLALDSFQETLPKKPYCTNDLSQGLLIRPKEMAVNFKYLQPDHPYYQNYLILDLDYESSLIEILYSMTGVPLPNLLVENKENGRSHVFFNLKTPIYKTDSSRLKPIIYANAVLRRLQALFNADVGYSGLIAKNPIHKQWRAYTLRDKPYSLNELASLLEIDWKEANKPIKQDEATGLGRNCYVFHTARFWAYKAVREFRGKTYNQWLQTVIDHCLKLNNGITEPMQYGEIKGIAKSIARYCWKRDPYCYQEFVQRQVYKGTLGGKARSNKYEDKRKQAIALKAKGLNNTQIAKELDVTRRTIINWFRV